MYDGGLTVLVPALAGGATLLRLVGRRAEGCAPVWPADAPDPADPAAMALLAGGPERVADTVLLGMHQSGLLVLDGRKARAGEREDDGSEPLRRLVRERTAGGAVASHRLHAELVRSAPVRALDQALVKDRLLRPLAPLRAWRRAWRWHLAVCVPSVLLGLFAAAGETGAAWLNPTSLLACALLVAGLFLAPFDRLSPQGRLTPAGGAALARLRTTHRHLDSSAWANAPACGHAGGHTDPEGIGVALFGTRAIRDKGLRLAIRKAHERPSSSSCGGCGGGCGGCGG
ncbi:TIGR04222 domain-containing membrane protein [Streptomyces sp. ISL-36]|uniref:TIGR04222 domain-containing membrane protein n=1 Tax=Streptomyces sp. ISL-36 TaxID=2819182 RepID=UPI001BEA8E04|nr:TIGR04222 domain-containing membrane protein [Streptomyces sp. ISL-36]MBT2439416.1 TIGR04222 domain-containing membrane protein [Streptomyces sp. ISL-36]